MGMMPWQPLFDCEAVVLYDSVLLDSDFTAVVSAFVANAVVNMPCAAVGADCESGHSGLVVCAALRCAGL